MNDSSGRRKVPSRTAENLGMKRGGTFPASARGAHRAREGPDVRRLRGRRRGQVVNRVRALNDQGRRPGQRLKPMSSSWRLRDPQRRLAVQTDCSLFVFWRLVPSLRLRGGRRGAAVKTDRVDSGVVGVKGDLVASSIDEGPARIEAMRLEDWSLREFVMSTMAFLLIAGVTLVTVLDPI